jgi:hypothetical protein
MSPIDEELFLGGFASSDLGIKVGELSGYGVYITNKRLIGVKNSKMGLSRMAGNIIPLIGIKNVVTASDDKSAIYDSSAKTIDQLEKVKDLEVIKEDISEIEVYKPHGFTKGYLRITKKSGENITIFILHFMEFEKMKDLMNVFYPERLKIVAIKSWMDLGR